MRRELAVVQDSSGKDARCTAARATQGSRDTGLARHSEAARLEDHKAALHDLTELTGTRGALDYSSADWTPPPRWLGFAAMHQWRDHAHVERLFTLVTDIRPPGQP